MGNIFNNMSILYSPNIFQIENKPYVILKIRDCQMLNSIGAANNGYTIIPLLNLSNGDSYFTPGGASESPKMEKIK